ncbi:MAG TPA: HAD-IA family hydrolase [Jiangellaceae bacterium]
MTATETGARSPVRRREQASLVLHQLDAVLFDLDTVFDAVRPREAAVALLARLRAAGVAVAVVSGRRPCAGLDGLVDVVVDGGVAAVMALAGPPDPAVYLEAARRLGVDPDRAAVVDDSAAGVAAGRRGNFGVVVGVGRDADEPELIEAGADFVVLDLATVPVEGSGPLSDGWHLTYHPTSEAGEGMRETLCTLANGYVGTRGAATWATADGVRYPGTYLAGVYNRLVSDVADRWVERESLVNAPNWLPLSFSADGGPFLGESGVTVTAEELRLDLHSGVLRRRYQVTDLDGRRTSVTERRLVSMADPHLAAISVDLIAENWSGRLCVRSGIDGTCCADQTVEARQLAHCHLRLAGTGEDPDGVAWLAARTIQSDVLIAEAARTRVDGASQPPQRAPGARSVAHEYSVELAKGARCRVEKIVAIHTSHDRAISEPVTAARQAVADAPGFAELLAAHRAAWARLWAQAGIEIDAAGRPAGVVNLHLFHLLQVAAPHVAELDVGLGARGLHGEGYEGHIFWDELFVFPVLNLRIPRVGRALLRYRQRRLPGARRLARAAGEAGARFPWQSGSDGRDETPTMLFNPRSRRWMPDRSANQRHVGLAVAYNYWQHWQTTADDAFFFEDGAEVLFEVARHFAHLAGFDEQLGRFRIRGVMGPDEFHDGYPWTDAAGIDDNAYTNVLTAWVLSCAVELAERLTHDRRGDILTRLGIDDAELTHFDDVARRLHVPFHDGIISQFAGYEQLEPINLDAYRDRYGNIGRLDLILEAEGDTVRRYQVAKQADALMLVYLFSLHELRRIFERLGYQLPDEMLQHTIDYYLARTTHGSTLSRVVHSWVDARRDRHASWQRFSRALAADMADTQGGTTAEGVHLGAMAGTIDILQRCYTGLETRAATLVLNPALPNELDHLRLNLAYRGHHLDIRIGHNELTVASAPGQAAPIAVELADRKLTLHHGDHVHRRLAGTPGTTRQCEPQQQQPTAITTDPVCGMTIEQSTAAASVTYHGSAYFFCSTACQEQFQADPDRYTAPETPQYA